MTRCSREDCTGLGAWTPVLLIRSHKKTPPLRAHLPEILQCTLHKDTSKLTDFLSDEGWDKIQKHLRQAGKGSFLKNLTQLDFALVKGAEKDPEWLPF